MIIKKRKSLSHKYKSLFLIDMINLKTFLPVVVKINVCAVPQQAWLTGTFTPSIRLGLTWPDANNAQINKINENWIHTTLKTCQNTQQLCTTSTSSYTESPSFPKPLTLNLKP